MYLKNKGKNIIIFNSAGAQKIRLYPGVNLVNETELKKHLKNNLVKIHMENGYITDLNNALISEEQKEQAKKYEADNYKLNKARKIFEVKKKVA